MRTKIMVDYFPVSDIEYWSACQTNFAIHVTFFFTIFVLSRVKTLYLTLPLLSIYVRGLGKILWPNIQVDT
jgi:hypothetical protein